MVEDYIDINAVTPMQRFSDTLAKVRLEMDRECKPFDEPCARLEFRDKLEQAEKESERRHGFVKVDEIKVEIGDLKKYADTSRFEFISEQPHMQDRVIEGSRTQVLTGYIRDYRCKERGHGISVFVPVSAYNSETSPAKKKKGE